MKKNIILPIVSAILVAIVAASIGIAWKWSNNEVAFKVSNTYSSMGGPGYQECCEEKFAIVHNQKELDELLREPEYEEKSYCTATIDDNFDGSSVIVI